MYEEYVCNDCYILFLYYSRIYTVMIGFMRGVIYSYVILLLFDYNYVLLRCGSFTNFA